MSASPVPVLCLDAATDRERVEHLLEDLRLDPRDLFRDDHRTAGVRQTLADVADRGDDAIVESARQFDDPHFTAEQIVVPASQMCEAAERVPGELIDALRRSIEQVRAYQEHLMPSDPPDLRRGGLELGMRYTALASAGCYFPGGKASYPSSLIHLVVPAQVAGVETIVAATPPSRYGTTDLVLAAGHLLGLPFMFRAGGAAAIAAMAFGTERVPRVDKIVGPGNSYVQIAKRLVSGGVGVDGFLGPSEVLVYADDSADPALVAADLLAQAEHDPGSCFLLTTDPTLPAKIVAELQRQIASLQRRPAIERALADGSALIWSEREDALLALANQIAAEHLSVQTHDPRQTLAKIPNAGCAFLGPHSPVAAGDYVAGPSHCLPTNTTARFGGGISVFEFLKRGGVVRYDSASIAADAAPAAALADAEGLDAHASSIRLRVAGR